MFYSEDERKNYEKAKIKVKEAIQKLKELGSSLQGLSPENQSRIVRDFRDKALLPNVHPALHAIYEIFKNF